MDLPKQYHNCVLRVPRVELHRPQELSVFVTSSLAMYRRKKVERAYLVGHLPLASGNSLPQSVGRQKPVHPL